MTGRVSATLRGFAELGRPTQVLLIAELSFNLGFSMLVPFLAVFLSDELGYPAWLVGLLLGLRVLSQQGLFVIGGSVADRLGYRPVILVGCGVRTVGFGLFCVVDSLPGVVVAILATGFAAALFSPAGQAYLALESGQRRVTAFALLNVAAQIGALTGPLIGVALLAVDFRLVAAAAAATFLLIGLLLARYLPARAGVEAGAEGSVLGDWRVALGHRDFVRLAVVMAGYAVLLHQLYLAIPLRVQSATGQQSATGVVFAVSSLVFILGQAALVRWAGQRWPPGRSITVGLALMAAAFGPLLAESLLSGVTGPAPAWVSLAVVGTAVVVLTVGVMLAQPFALDQVARLSGDRRVGTYYGLYYLAGALAVVAGNGAGGLAVDLVDAGAPPLLPWAMFLLIGAAATAGARWLHRSGRLAEPARSAAGRHG